jgi:hypothetical protein
MCAQDEGSGDEQCAGQGMIAGLSRRGPYEAEETFSAVTLQPLVWLCPRNPASKSIVDKSRQAKLVLLRRWSADQPSNWASQNDGKRPHGITRSREE